MSKEHGQKETQHLSMGHVNGMGQRAIGKIDQPRAIKFGQTFRLLVDSDNIRFDSEQSSMLGACLIDSLTILSNHDVDVDGWYKMIETWYREHRGQSPQEAMLSYLQLAQDLETFGVDYFEIRNRRGTDLLLGIDAIGLAVYKPPDK
ncbi:unnamed protein product [Dibothriocephalus latus]|uniref:FERM domain-containing protein n=1 Tax=Dibothriocephalus latus TaxID=60516 RepID=A0A3P7NAN6_DIBLA|nr:unnamed protein product [Dibothriocephalus latus]